MIPALLLLLLLLPLPTAPSNDLSRPITISNLTPSTVLSCYWISIPAGKYVKQVREHEERSHKLEILLLQGSICFHEKK